MVGVEGLHQLLAQEDLAVEAAAVVVPVALAGEVVVAVVVAVTPEAMAGVVLAEPLAL